MRTTTSESYGMWAQAPHTHTLRAEMYIIAAASNTPMKSPQVLHIATMETKQPMYATICRGLDMLLYWQYVVNIILPVSHELHT